MAKSKKNADSVEKFQKDYLLHECCSDFWHYIYTNAFLYSSDDDSEYINFMRLRDEFDAHVESRDKQKEILNAILQKQLSGDSVFDLSMLPTNTFNLSKEVFSACCKYGYYQYDLAEYIYPNSIITHMLENEGALPFPPVPFPCNEEQKRRLMVQYMLTTPIFDGNIERMKYFLTTYPMNAPHNPLIEGFDENKDNVQFHLNRLERIFTFDMVQGNKIQAHEDYSQKFAKLKKESNKSEYAISSKISRAVGLLLWNNVIRSDEKEVIVQFKNSPLYSEINEKLEFSATKDKYLADKDDSILTRWMKLTAKCVTERRVASFK